MLFRSIISAIAIGAVSTAYAGPDAGRHHARIGSGDAPFRLRHNDHHKRSHRDAFDFTRDHGTISVDSQGDLSFFESGDAFDRSVLSHRERGVRWPHARGIFLGWGHHAGLSDDDTDQEGSNWNVNRGSGQNAHVAGVGGDIDFQGPSMRVVPLPGAAAMAAMTLGGGLLVRRIRRR